MSKTERLKQYLQTGAQVTPKQVSAMFGISRPSAAIHQLRQEGVCIYTNPVTLKRTGEQTVKYRIGTPSKAMVAAAFAAGFRA